MLVVVAIRGDVYVMVVIHTMQKHLHLEVRIEGTVVLVFARVIDNGFIEYQEIPLNKGGVDPDLAHFSIYGTEQDRVSHEKQNQSTSRAHEEYNQDNE